MITLKLTEAEYFAVRGALAEASDEHDTADNLHYYNVLLKVRQAKGKTPKAKPPKPFSAPMQHRDDAWVAYLLSMQNGNTVAVANTPDPLCGTDDPNRPHTGYICTECAKRLGGVWPDGHCATCHGGVCPECKEHKGLCSVDDWDWPKGSKRPKHGAGRD